MAPTFNREEDRITTTVASLLVSLFLPVLMRLDKKLSVFDRANALPSLPPSENGWFYVAAIENTNLR